MLQLEPFQARFLKAATAPNVHLAALSLARGNGKSRLAAYLVERILTPTDPLFRPGTESVLVAASIEQARIVFRFACAELETTGQYRFIDSATRAAILHLPTNTRLRVLGSNGKTAFGLVGCPWVIADEPGSWETTGGQLLHDAIETSKGKPDSPLRSLYIGTIAPSVSGWWSDLATSKSGQGRAIMCLQGDRERWDQWREVARCNPLVKVSAAFRKQLRAELKAAQLDSRLKARFLRVRPETLCRITEFSEHESNGRELDEGERVAVEVLPVLGQSAAAVEPGDGAFDHPTPGLDDEALHPIGSLDDLGLEIGQDAGQGAVKDRPLIGAVGEQFPEKGKQTEQGRQQRETAVAILNVGGGDDAVQQQALRIDQNMPLLALDQLAGIEAVAVDASPPFSALFTL